MSQLLFCVGCARYQYPIPEAGLKIAKSRSQGTKQGWDAFRKRGFPDAIAVLCKPCERLEGENRCLRCRNSKMAGFAYESDREVTVFIVNHPQNQVVPLIWKRRTGMVWNVRFRQLENVGIATPLVIDVPRDCDPSALMLHVPGKEHNFWGDNCHDIHVRLTENATTYGTNGYPIAERFVREYIRPDTKFLTLQRISEMLDTFSRKVNDKDGLLVGAGELACIKLEERHGVAGHTGWHVASFCDEYDYYDNVFLFESLDIPDNPVFDCEKIVQTDTKWFSVEDLIRLWPRVNAIRKVVDRNWPFIHNRLWGPDGGLMVNRSWKVVCELLKT